MTQGTVVLSIYNKDTSPIKSQIQKCLWCDTPLSNHLSQNICEDCQKGVENEWTKLITNNIIKEHIIST